MRRPVCALTCLLVLVACGNPAAGRPGPALSTASTTSTVPTSSAAPTSSTPPPPPAPPPAPETPAPPATPTPPTGSVVVLDPGHNGGNAANPNAINRQVPAGRGRTKACNTTGTATNAGYPEHAFAWDVAVRVRDILVAHGVQVILTRPDDTGVGPCVNERAAVGNNAAAAAVVSIHADGSTEATAHGFHVAYSAPPLNAAQGDPAIRLATTMRDGLSAAGFRTANYLGDAGLSARDDLGGLNLSEVPAILVECGNMRNAEEAAAFSSAPGRQSYADAIATATLTYLTVPPPRN